MRHDEADAAKILRALDDIGAISLETLIGSAEKVRGTLSGFELDDPDRLICYPFVIRIGPKDDYDIVTVAADLKDLGFEINRIGH
jgi:hypothetical protein